MCRCKFFHSFKKKFCLPFPLASDSSGQMCEDYGVWVEKSMYGKTYMGIVRSTFLIDKSGKVARSWPKVSVTGHAARAPRRDAGPARRRARRS